LRYDIFLFPRGKNGIDQKSVEPWKTLKGEKKEKRKKEKRERRLVRGGSMDQTSTRDVIVQSECKYSICASTLTVFWNKIGKKVD